MPKEELNYAQMVILWRLMDGPFDGLGRGPRPAVSFINDTLPFNRLGLRKKERSQRPTSMAYRTKAVMKQLVERELVCQWKKLVNNVARNQYKITEAGVAAFELQKDDRYKKKAMRDAQVERARRKAAQHVWILDKDPGRSWKRWMSRKNGWKLIVQNHPVNGWQFMLVMPDGTESYNSETESPWFTSPNQEEALCRRNAEATWRNIAGEMKES